MSDGDYPEAVHYLAAIALALEAAGDDESALRIIDLIVQAGPKANGADTWPTKILVNAIQEGGARIEVGSRA